MPDVHDARILLDELEAVAKKSDIGFDRVRAERFVNDTRASRAWLEATSPYVFEAVPAFRDKTTHRCDDVQQCCELGVRLVRGHGEYTCEDAARWYRDSGCCQSPENDLVQKTSWPPYLHLKDQLDGKVMWLSSANESNVLIMDVVQHLSKDAIFFEDTVVHVSQRADGWELDTTSGTRIRSKTLVFANGGFGAEATPDELEPLAVADTTYVHARNTRLLRELTIARSWELDDSNAWFVEFVDDQPKWFLWDARSTVVASDGAVYDESASYDERGRARRRLNVSVATLLYEVESSEERPNPEELGAARRSPSKDCDTRSKRLWRNYLAEMYGLGQPVSEAGCAARVEADTPVRRKTIYQGIIDTISGPKTDVDHRVRSDPTVYVAGNAGAPHLIEAYVGPGSTLGNAFVSGYAAGKHAALTANR